MPVRLDIAARVVRVQVEDVGTVGHRPSQFIAMSIEMV
jgi:hypothetical protein